MTTVLVFVVGMAIVAGVVYVMMRMLRSHHQLIERRREVWRAKGSVGLEPARHDIGHGYGGFSPRRLTQLSFWCGGCSPWCGGYAVHVMGRIG